MVPSLDPLIRVAAGGGVNYFGSVFFFFFLNEQRRLEDFNPQENVIKRYRFTQHTQTQRWVKKYKKGFGFIVEKKIWMNKS